MPNSLQSSAIASPASRRATNCSLSSITEHSFQGIIPSPLRGESVTYVSGTMCYLCLRPLIQGVTGCDSGNSSPQLNPQLSVNRVIHPHGGQEFALRNPCFIAVFLSVQIESR